MHHVIIRTHPILVHHCLSKLDFLPASIQFKTLIPLSRIKELKRLFQSLQRALRILENVSYKAETDFLIMFLFFHSLEFFLMDFCLKSIPA